MDDFTDNTANLSTDNTADLSAKVIQAARKCGFDAVGISDLELPQQDLDEYIRWIEQEYYGQMDYLKNNLSLRLDPRLLQAQALSVITVAVVYRTSQNYSSDKSVGQISAYARGRDYHKVLKNKLKQLSKEIISLYSPYQGRAFVDSGPVFEKLYGQQAGLGIKGRNSLLINPRFGSQFFIGELITNLPLKATPKIQEFDPCKSCKTCQERCPMQCILDNRMIDASRCISYLTIEYHGIIPREYCIKMGNRIFGCDECQSSCPWNKRRIYTKEGDFTPRLTAEFLKLENLLRLTEADFLQKFEGSVIRRAGWISFMRNVIIAAGNSANPQLIPLIQCYTCHPDEILQTHARWAIQMLTQET